MERKTKREADYGPGKPSAHCGICKHFKPPQGCAIVEGLVSASYWCKYFSRRSRAEVRYGGKA